MSSLGNTYQWVVATLAVPSLQVNGSTLQGVISTITQVRSIASNGTMSGPDIVYSPLCPVPVPAPTIQSLPSFIPLADLTSNDLLAMAQAALGPDEWAALQSRADAVLSNAIAQAAAAQNAAAAAADAPIPGPTLGNGSVVIPTELTAAIATLQQAQNPAQPVQALI